MVAYLYTEGIQLTAAHSGGRCSDLTQENVLFIVLVSLNVLVFCMNSYDKKFEYYNGLWYKCLCFLQVYMI